MSNISCAFANRIIMKYMDGRATEKELALLRAHAGECPSCGEDLELYGRLMTDFNQECLEEAPDGFDDAVMTKIAALDITRESVQARVESFMCCASGVFSALIGVGVLLFLNKEPLLNYLAGNERFLNLIDVWASVSIFADRLSAGATAFMSSSAAAVAPYLSNARPTLLVAALALGFTRYILYKRVKPAKLGRND
ncbi:MAG: zf-HC2 domain-containing protein [Clostridiales bacterium]|jgi:anti-sigma factor RsiW|nr:zf-HC2 domain-containing protein [Clostridiales bacterium]